LTKVYAEGSGNLRNFKAIHELVGAFNLVTFSSSLENILSKKTPRIKFLYSRVSYSINLSDQGAKRRGSKAFLRFYLLFRKYCFQNIILKNAGNLNFKSTSSWKIRDFLHLFLKVEN